MAVPRASIFNTPLGDEGAEMQNTIVWLTVAGAIALLCTGHLFLGVMLGRRSANLADAKHNMDSAIEPASESPPFADRLLQLAAQLREDCQSALSQSSGDIEREFKLVADAISALHKVLHETVIFYQEAVQRASGEKASPKTFETASLLLDENNESSAVSAFELAEQLPTSDRAPQSADGPVLNGSASTTPFDNGKEFPPDDQPLDQVRIGPIHFEPSHRKESSNGSTEAETDLTTRLSREEIDIYRTGSAEDVESRRRDSRFPYQVFQYMSPVHDMGLPPATRFVRVKCRDLSCKGISFFCKDSPITDEVIITLGTAPHLTFVTARVSHRRKSSLDGEFGFTVGCEFKARLPSDLPGTNPLREHSLFASES